MVSYAGALITTHGQSSPPPPAETVQECWGPFQSCHEPSPLWNMQQRAVWCIFMMSSVLTLLESKALCKNGKTTEYLQPFDARADLRQHQSRDHTKRQDMRAAPHGWTVAPAYAGHKTQKTRWTSRLRLKGQRSRHDAPSSKPCDKSQRKHQWLRAAVMRQAEAFPDFLWRGRWKHCVFEFWSNDHKKGMRWVFWQQSHTRTIPKTDKMEMSKPALLKKTVWHQCKHSRTGQRKSIQLKYADTHTRN